MFHSLSYDHGPHGWDTNGEKKKKKKGPSLALRASSLPQKTSRGKGGSQTIKDWWRENDQREGFERNAFRLPVLFFLSLGCRLWEGGPPKDDDYSLFIVNCNLENLLSVLSVGIVSVMMKKINKTKKKKQQLSFQVPQCGLTRDSQALWLVLCSFETLLLTTMAVHPLAHVNICLYVFNENKNGGKKQKKNPLLSWSQPKNWYLQFCQTTMTVCWLWNWIC